MRVVLSGCSGGGKTTLLDELARRGFATVAEPGLRIVREERAGDGRALPWVDPAAFARRAVAMAQADLAASRQMAAPVFFDRGLVDAATALEHATGRTEPSAWIGCESYHRRAFLVPPWPENLRPSVDRVGDLAAAIAEYDRLLASYTRLGFVVDVLAPAPVWRRADHVLGRLGLA